MDRNLLHRVPEFVEPRNGEFCVALDFSSNFIADVCRHGYIPMGEIARGRPILLIKSHRKRCVLNFEDLHISRKLKRHARNLSLHINRDFSACLQQTIQSHQPNNWIIKPLSDSFIKLHRKKELGIQFCSIEIYAEDQLVAGEIGYITGSIYTSLSGFHTKNGSGSVQLAILGKLLQESCFSYWDLGMEIDYKKNLGAHVMERQPFLDLWQEKSKEKSPQWITTYLDSAQIIQKLRRQ